MSHTSPTSTSTRLRRAGASCAPNPSACGRNFPRPSRSPRVLPSLSTILRASRRAVNAGNPVTSTTSPWWPFPLPFMELLPHRFHLPPQIGERSLVFHDPIGLGRLLRRRQLRGEPALDLFGGEAIARHHPRHLLRFRRGNDDQAVHSFVDSVLHQ